MGANAMLNVRLDRGLKAEGDGVLARAGITASDAIRRLYRFMKEHQEVPAFCLSEDKASSAEVKRAAMRELIGIAPLKQGESARSIKAERLSRVNL